MNKTGPQCLSYLLLSLAKLGFFCFLFLSTPSYAQKSVLAVMSSEGKIYKKFYSALNNKLEDNLVLSQTSPDKIYSEMMDKYDYIISIGNNAARAVSQYKSNATIIYSLTPDNTHLTANTPCINKNCYEVYINQPIYRYIKLFKFLFPANETLVFVKTRQNTTQLKQLRSAAKKLGVSYKEIEISESSNIARTLINKLNKNDVLLALPNTQIYNKNNAKSIILSTYHKNVPIIAYSKSFAKAGALISLYSSIENIAEETANLANKISSIGQQKQKQYYPENFSVEINSAVSQSLNINLASKNIIMGKIK